MFNKQELSEDDLNEEMPRKTPQNALSRWIDSNMGGDRWAFADRINVDRHYIDALCRDEKQPELEVAAKIEKETGGTVSIKSWVKESVKLLKKFIFESLNESPVYSQQYYKQKEALWNLWQTLGFMEMERESNFVRSLYNKITDEGFLDSDDKERLIIVLKLAAKSPMRQFNVNYFINLIELFS